jgi:hypothetical protein
MAKPRSNEIIFPPVIGLQETMRNEIDRLATLEHSKKDACRCDSRPFIIMCSTQVKSQQLLRSPPDGSSDVFRSDRADHPETTLKFKLPP